MVVVECRKINGHKKTHIGINNGKVGRPRKTYKKRIHLTLSEWLVDYIWKYKNDAGRDYSGSEHIEELIKLGMAFNTLIQVLLTDRSQAEIDFILSQIHFSHNYEFIF